MIEWLGMEFMSNFFCIGLVALKACVKRYVFEANLLERAVRRQEGEEPAAATERPVTSGQETPRILYTNLNRSFLCS